MKKVDHDRIVRQIRKAHAAQLKLKIGVYEHQIAELQEQVDEAGQELRQQLRIIQGLETALHLAIMYLRKAVADGLMEDCVVSASKALKRVIAIRDSVKVIK